MAKRKIQQQTPTLDKGVGSVPTKLRMQWGCNGVITRPVSSLTDFDWGIWSSYAPPIALNTLNPGP